MASVAALATANRTGAAPSPVARGRGGRGTPGDRGRGHNRGGQNNHNHQNRGRGVGHSSHNRGGGHNSHNRRGGHNSHNRGGHTGNRGGQALPRPPSHHLMGQLRGILPLPQGAPQPPNIPPSSSEVSGTVATPADAIQISSESDEDIDTDPDPEDEDDDTPYYGGYGRCYRCSKFYICRVREPVKKKVWKIPGGEGQTLVWNFPHFF